MTFPDEVLAEVRRLFEERGATVYLGEAVTQLDHALQCARLADRAGASNELVVAALLHDVGHLLHDPGEGGAELALDARHEALGTRFLSSWFGPAVTQPIALHVATLCDAGMPLGRLLDESVFGEEETLTAVGRLLDVACSNEHEEGCGARQPAWCLRSPKSTSGLEPGAWRIRVNRQ